MNGYPPNTFATPEAMFEHAVYLAQIRQRQPAYNLFKEISRTQLGVWNPNIWLWIASLTPDFKEGEAALAKAAELGPLHPDLAKARADFAFRKQTTLKKRRIGFWGLVSSFSVLAFLMAFIAEIFPTVGSIPGIYVRQFMDKGTAVGYTWLLVFFCIGFTSFYLSNRTFKKWWISPLIVLGLLVAIGVNTGVMLEATGRAETYHNKVQVNGAVYHLETVRRSFVFYDNRQERIIRVFKCDPTGVVCSKHFTGSYHFTGANYSYYNVGPDTGFVLSYNGAAGLQVQRTSGQVLIVPL